MKITIKKLKQLIKEATGDGGPELVDETNFQHLEVGNEYMITMGDDHVRATFVNWVDKSGNPAPLDLEDPEQIDLRFADSDDGMEWEAYWMDDAYVAGSSGDPIEVEEIESPWARSR